MAFDLTKLTLRPFTEKELAQTHAWLNEPVMQEVTKTAPFTREQQGEWLKGLSSKNDFIVKTLYAEEKLIGAWGLKRINWNDKHAEPFYYIGDTAYQGLGIGEWLMNQSISACKERGFRKMMAVLVVKNFRIVNLHFKYGFRIYQYEDGLYYLSKSL